MTIHLFRPAFTNRGGFVSIGPRVIAGIWRLSILLVLVFCGTGEGQESAETGAQAKTIPTAPPSPVAESSDRDLVEEISAIRAAGRRSCQSTGRAVIAFGRGWPNEGQRHVFPANAAGIRIRAKKALDNPGNPRDFPAGFSHRILDGSGGLFTSGWSVRCGQIVDPGSFFPAACRSQPGNGCG